MQKLKLYLIIISVFVMTTGCQTIKEKTDAIVEKENEKLSKYISKSASLLQMDLGKPDEDFKMQKGIMNLSTIQKNMEFHVKEDSKLIQKIL